MRNKKPDYKGFVLHMRELEIKGIPYWIEDLRDISLKYNCPINNTKKMSNNELIKVRKVWMDSMSKDGAVKRTIEDIVLIIGGIVAVCSIIIILYLGTVGIK